MNTISEQRPTSYSEENYGTETTEKTIPFLRRLVDMLSENESVISFCPGSIKNGHVTLGRIVVHDRIKVENEILPRYFNHSSFASLRRQLNYFSFTRIGKGRQKGATYCNEGVVVIEDILRLRRRSTSVSSGSANDNSLGSANNRRRSTSVSSGSANDNSSGSATNRRREQLEPPVTKAVLLPPKASSVTIASPGNQSKRALFDSSFLHSSHSSQQPMKKIRHGGLSNRKGDGSALHISASWVTPTIVSPVVSPLHSPSTSPNDDLQVILDLTVPTTQLPRTSRSTPKPMNEITSSAFGSNNDIIQPGHRNISYSEDPDILAGCRALLSFSHGIYSLTA